MLEWVFIAILAYLFSSAGAITDKITRARYFTHSTSITVLFLLCNGLPALLLPFASFGALGVPTIALALFAGFLTIVPLWLYSEALRHEEISRVAPIWQAIPLFVLVFAFIFLGERLPQNFYIAFVLMLVGSILVSAKNFGEMLKPDRTFWLMLFASMSYSAYPVMLKYLYNNSAGFLGIFALVCVGRLLAAALILLLPLERRSFLEDFQASDKRVILAMFVFAVSAGILYNYAVSLGPITMVEVLSGVYPLFVLLFAIVLSKWMPAILSERIEPKAVLVKAFAIAIMFIGLALLYL
jgi:drug/metabolite transporter (DMT)-like permease